MEKLDLKGLKLAAAKSRLLALDAVHEAASGHPGGSLSCLDMLTALYFHEMNIDPADPKKADRDRFVLSKGHCSPALYATLAQRGFFPVEELKLFRSIKAHYSGHPDMVHVPGVDMSTGSLGQGLSAAVGMALAAKLRSKSYRTYAVCGDGGVRRDRTDRHAPSPPGRAVRRVYGGAAAAQRAEAPLALRAGGCLLSRPPRAAGRHAPPGKAAQPLGLCGAAPADPARRALGGAARAPSPLRAQGGAGARRAAGDPAFRAALCRISLLSFRVIGCIMNHSQRIIIP